MQEASGLAGVEVPGVEQVKQLSKGERSKKQ